MIVIRARVLGFCMGVRRAVELAYGEAASLQASACKPVYTLGSLIHNPQVLDELKRRGVETLNEERLPADLGGASVIIRAHGLSPQTEAELRRRGARVVDATCPRVKSSQLKAAAFAQAGYRLFLAGEERHAEINGIRRYYEDAARVCAVVGNAAEAEQAAAQAAAAAAQAAAAAAQAAAAAAQAAAAAAQAAAALRAESPNAKAEAARAEAAQAEAARAALIGQTTISEEEYREIGEIIARYFPDLEIAQTICAATKERQDSLREIADKVDAIIIAGGKDSANTRRLLVIAEAAGKPCALVETPADIPPEFFTFNTVGLASGTSTPDTVIDAIERALCNAR